MDSSRVFSGYVLVLAGAALFSAKAIFIKLAYMEQADPLLMLTWRMIFSLPFFIGIGLYVHSSRIRRGLLPPSLPLIVRAVLAGLLGYYLAMVLDFEALVYVTAQLERLALFTYPIFLLFIGSLFFGARLTHGHLVSAGITYAGLACVFLADFKDGGSNVPLGTALVLASAIAFAVYQLLATNLIAALGSILFTSFALSGAAFASIIQFLAVRGAGELAASPRFIWLAAATGILSTVIPSFFVNAGMSRIGPQSTAMISTVSPLITIYLAVLLLGERFTLIDGVGTALVFLGVGYHTWLDLRKSHS